MAAQPLIRWGGIASIIFGGLYAFSAIVNVNSPTVPGQWLALAGTLFAVFALMALYAVQVERSGVVGLIGFVLTVIGLTVAMIGEFLILARRSGLDANREVLGFYNAGPLGPLVAFGLLLGLIVFGLAIWRAGILPRWAGGLLVIGSVLSFITGAVGLPPIGNAIALVLVGGGFVWLGWALFSGMAEAAKQPRATTPNA